MDEVIAVTGATGRVGGRVVRRLVAEGATVRAMGRDAGKLAQLPAAEHAVASYDDAAAMRAALAGASTLFLVSAHEGPGRVGTHTTAVDAALAAGVRRVVYLSYLGAAPHATFTYARDHWYTEQHIRAAGVPFTFLRDSSYQSDLVAMTGDDGILRGPAGDGRVAAVTHDDVADSTSAVLLTAGQGIHDGLTYDLTGPEALSFDEIAATIAEATGRPVAYQPETRAEAYASRAVYGAPAWEVEGWVSSYEAVASGEMDVVSDAVRALTGRAPQAFADFLAAHLESLRRLLPK
ncbi:SDR family NAD(P)-dependent oxidoreductase [Streptacidiphilus pinicola]|uniref:SDR family NAD(P)-dependent oxidoreductase n=1 Tax=Streptacidiphilus pinicola TaxID=2219663 RepID=A0A2X0KJ84_9ACTN|nr:NAD(P)H-binding protein [Streptacidiphilus pinicola]RAG86790.1 SDR family NAD(P)-dependent oxidoreductase [Streptacidiphilus pinicola]